MAGRPPRRFLRFIDMLCVFGFDHSAVAEVLPNGEYCPASAQATVGLDGVTQKKPAGHSTITVLFSGQYAPTCAHTVITLTLQKDPAGHDGGVVDPAGPCAGVTQAVFVDGSGAE